MLRTFNATGTDIDTDSLVRVRNLRLGEPCAESGQIKVPGLLTEVPPEEGEWSSGGGGTGGSGCSGCGGGGGGGGGTGPSPVIDGTLCDTYTTGAAALAYATVPDCNTVKIIAGGTGGSATGATAAGYSKVTTAALSNSDRTITMTLVTTWSRTVTDDPQHTGVFWAYCEPNNGVGTAYQYGLMFADTTTPSSRAVPTQLAAVKTGTYTYTCNVGYRPKVYGGSGLTAGSASMKYGVVASLGNHYETPPDAGPALDGGVAATMTVGTGASDMMICTNDVEGGGATSVPLTNEYKFDKDNPIEMNDPEGYEPMGTVLMPFLATSACKNIKEIYLTVCVWVVPNGPTSFSCFETQWLFISYQNGNPYGDKTPEQDLCDYAINPVGGCGPILFPNPNAPEGVINCVIVYTDPANPITNIADLVVGLGPWSACMIVPKGWDRGGKIPQTWTQGQLGKMNTAFAESVPDGITCGVVASMPVFGNTITLNTCDADLAPAIVKIVVGYVIIIGMCFLIVRRIMWSVGSK